MKKIFFDLEEMISKYIYFFSCINQTNIDLYDYFSTWI